MKPSGRIFISYRRTDTAHIAGRLFDRLETRFGAGNVFMDVDSIEPGRDFSEAIQDAVGSCDVLLALIGSRWLDATDGHDHRRLEDPDDFVALEIITALQRPIRVIPVLVDGAAPPRRDDLPDALAPLARRQGIQLDHATFGGDVTALMTTLERREAEATRPVSAPPPPRTQREAARTNRPNRETQRAAALARREGMARGDDRYLLPRDRGPVKAYIRDVVDSRAHIMGLFMPTAAVVLISVVLPFPALQQYLSLFSLICLLTMIIEGIFLGLSTTRKVRVKFPNERINALGVGWYAFTRASQIRKFRAPKPRVERGSNP